MQLAESHAASTFVAWQKMKSPDCLSNDFSENNALYIYEKVFWPA